MLKILIVSLTCYVWLETFLLATAPGSSGDKKCFVMKYVFATAASGMMVTQPPALEYLIALVAIALFMWGTTFYRALAWLEANDPLTFTYLNHYLKVSSRRQKG